MSRVVTDYVEVVGMNLVRRQHTGAIPGVYPCLLDVLHDATDDHPLAIGHGVHVHLVGILKEPIEEDGMLWRRSNCLAHVVRQLVIVVDDGHGAASQHVRGSHQHRIADSAGHADSLVQRAGCTTWWLGDAQPVQQLPEALPILSQINGIRRCPPDGYTCLLQGDGQLQWCLPP